MHGGLLGNSSESYEFLIQKQCNQFLNQMQIAATEEILIKDLIVVRRKTFHYRFVQISIILVSNVELRKWYNFYCRYKIHQNEKFPVFLFFIFSRNIYLVRDKSLFMSITLHLKYFSKRKPTPIRISPKGVKDQRTPFR